MASLFQLKRAAYLWAKRIVNKVPPLKAANRIRRKVRGAKTRKAVASYGATASTEVIKALEDGGFEPILAFGTLLGAIRENRILRHDNDLDYAVQIDSNEEWQRLKECMEAAGYVILRQFSLKGSITEQAYQGNGYSFDVFGFMPVEGSKERRAFYYCLLDEGKYESEDDRSVKYMDFPPFEGRMLVEVDGVMLPVPDNAEEILSRAYTERWRTPDPAWVSGSNWKIMEGVVERRQVFRKG